MIINDIVKNVETIIAVDIAKNSFQVFVSNQKTGKQKNQKVSRTNFVYSIREKYLLNIALLSNI